MAKKINKRKWDVNDEAASTSKRNRKRVFIYSDDSESEQSDHETLVNNKQSLRFRKAHSGLRDNIVVGKIRNTNYINWVEFLNDSKDIIFKLIKEAVDKHNSIRLNIKLLCEFSIQSYSLENVSAQQQQVDENNVLIENNVKDSIKYMEKNFGGRRGEIYPSSNLEEYFETIVMDSISKEMEEFAIEGSGHSFSKLKYITIGIYKYVPVTVGATIPLPKVISNKNCCINVQNRHNDKCVLYAIAASQHPGNQQCPIMKKNTESFKYKDYETIVNTDGIVFPMTLAQFPRLEKLNPEFSFSVIGLERSKTHGFTAILIRPCKVEKPKHVNLLMFKEEHRYELDKSDEDITADQIPTNLFYSNDPELDLDCETDDSSSANLRQHQNQTQVEAPISVQTKYQSQTFEDEVDDDFNEKIPTLFNKINTFDDSEDVYHFCWIRDLSRLFQKQIKKTRARVHFCNRCFHYFYKIDNLYKHKEKCMEMNFTSINLPPPGTFLEFKNYHEQLEMPMYCVADIETLLQDVNDPEDTTKNSKKIQRHVPFSCAIYLHCTYDETKCDGPKIFYGPDCMEKFMKQLRIYTKKFQKVISIVRPMNPLTPQEIQYCRTAKDCHICNKPLNKDETPHLDHCHISRRFRGLAHPKCNLRYRLPNVLPVLFHNLSNYDAPFVLKALVNSVYLPGHVSVIPITTEKYITFTKHIIGCKVYGLKSVNIRFLDSYRFLSGSLDVLSKLLPKEKLKNLKKECDKRNYTEEQFELMTKKGIFCYDFVNSMDSLKLPHPPTKAQFHNSLTNRDITDAEYEQVLKVWKVFKMKTLECYSKLYLLIDVLLLADVIENFRQGCFETYKIDPLHSLTLPSFGFSAFLKYSQVSYFYYLYFLK